MVAVFLFRQQPLFPVFRLPVRPPTKLAVADTGFARGDHGQRAEREPKRGSGAGRAPGGGQECEAPLKLKAFCTFYTKKVANS